MRVLAHTKSPSGNVIELSEEGGKYRLTLYLPEPDSVRELGSDEAREWLKLAKSSGGIVVGEVGT